MSLMRCSIFSSDQLEYIVDFGLTADATPALKNGFFEAVFDAVFDAAFNECAFACLFALLLTELLPCAGAPDFCVEADGCCGLLRSRSFAALRSNFSRASSSR